MERKIAELNQKLLTPSSEGPSERPRRQALRQLAQDCLPRQRKYEAQAHTLAGRNSYARTDPEATCMRMKEDRGAEQPWPKPAYNRNHDNYRPDDPSCHCATDPLYRKAH